MSTELPRCLQRSGKAERIDQVLELIRQNAEVTFPELHKLVRDKLGVSASTAYDYIRQARETLEQRVPTAATPTAVQDDQ